MKSYREQFEEIWPVPEGVEFCDVFGGYWHKSTQDKLSVRFREHDIRLDTFTRCQETTDVYSSIIDEMIDEVEGLSIAAYGCVIGKTQDIIDRAQSLLDYKK